MIKSQSTTLLAILLLAGLCLVKPALAQTAGSEPLSLDLSSNQQTLAAPAAGTINTSSGNLEVKPGDLLTPAQYAAVAQVLSGQSQSLLIDAAGRAVGGSLALSAISDSLHTVTVPNNVTLYGAQTGNQLNLSGGLINSGTLFALPLNTASSFQLNAAFVQNNTGGLISSILPQSMPAAINLNINTIGNVVNLGSITSGGVLNISAGASVINGIAGQASTALLSGAMGTNINSAIGNIVNSGIITSQFGNVAISTALAKDLSINNTYGSILSSLGSVNFNNLTEAVKGTIDLSGGIVDAREVTFNVSDGIVDAVLDEIRGPVDVHAGAAHLTVAGGTLTLRELDLTGDPSFINSNGDVVLLPNALTVLQFPGQDLAILASGDVMAGGGLTQIDLSSPTGGGNLFISAGLSISPATAGQQQEPPLVPGGYTLGLPSLTGGSVDLPGVDIVTSGNNAGATSGSVTIIAHDNNNISENTFAANDNGFIRVGGIDTSSSFGRGGNVFVVAQSDSLTLNNVIVTTGATPATSGSAAIISGEPVANNLTFVDGTQQQIFVNGVLQPSGVLVNNDAAHDPVPINLVGSIPSGGIFSDYLVNASGAVTLGTNLDVLQANNSVTLASRMSSVAIGDGVQVAANGGQLQVVAGTNINLGTNSLLTSLSDCTLLANNGSITGGGLNVLASQANLNLTAIGGDFVLGGAGQNELYSSANLTLSTSGRIDIGASVFAQVANSISMLAGDTLSLAGGSMTAGALQAGSPAPPALLSAANIATQGGMFLFAENSLQSNATLQSTARDLVVASRNGSIQLNNSAYFGEGGTVLIASGAQITGTNTSFRSRSVGGPNNFLGGIIQVSSGYDFTGVPAFAPTTSTATNLSNAAGLEGAILGKSPFIPSFYFTAEQPFNSPALDAGGFVQDPTIMGANVSISNFGIGVGSVQAVSTGGASIDVSGLANPTVSVRRGAVIFTATGAANNIALTNSSYDVAAYSNTNPRPPGEFALVLDSTDNFTFPFDLSQFNVNESSNINTNTTRLVNIHIYLGSESAKAAPGDKKAGDAGTGQLSESVFDSSGFRGFDTGRIEQSHRSLLPNAQFQVRSGESASGGPRYAGTFNSLSSSASNFGSGLASGARGPASFGGLGFQPLNIMQSQSVASSPVRVSQSHGDLVLFTTAGQVLTGAGGSQGGNAIGAQGTTVSNEKDSLLLHGGKIFANSGKTPMKVVTMYGTIELPPEASAAVEVNPNGSGRLIMLAAKGKSYASLRVGGRVINLQAGEQLQIQPDISEEDIPNLTRGVIVKEEVPVGRLIEKENEGFYQNRSIRMSGNASGAYQRMLERINKWNGPESGQQANATGKPSVESKQATASIKGISRTESPARILAAAGTIYEQQAANLINLTVGSLFIKPDLTQTIKTPLGGLLVEGGASAEVQVRSGQVRFRSYSGPDRVKVLAANKQLSLAPGQELVLQNQKPTRAEALPDDGIARRGLANFVLPNGVYGVAGDFSILSSIQAESHLRPVRASNTKENRELKARMLKTAASLNLLRGSHGRYFSASQQKSHLPGDAFIDGGNSDNPRVSYANK